MIWVDYTIDSYPDGSFKVRGDSPTEVMDKGLYKPGDVFVVNSAGVLCKIDSATLPITNAQKIVD